jgi:predicted RecB family nuclease
MKKENNNIIFSPSDLANHLSCKHLTNLNKKAAFGLIKKPTFKNRVLDMLRDRGIAFEAEFLKILREEGKTIIEITQTQTDAAQATIDAMHQGVDVIYQARLVENGVWGGWSDFILKVDTPSNLGSWSYEVMDTKLATETRAGTILQIALYSEKVGSIQGRMPENMWVENPDGRTGYRVNDYISFVRLAKRKLLNAIVNNNQTYPEPVTHCDICSWWEECNKQRRKDDHLGFVAGMGTTQIKEMKIHGVKTLESFAQWQMPDQFKPLRGAADTYQKLKEQARVQYTGRIKSENVYETLEVEPEKGFNKLPEPSKYDIYLDLEGDLMVDPGGLEYLFGWYCEGKYTSIWVSDESDEKAAFETFVKFAIQKLSVDPTAHIYHYAPYETTAFKRIMSKYATCENEIDSFLRAGVFVDLYGIVRQSIRASVEKYSIKDLEKFFGYVRAMDLRQLSKYKAEYEFLLEIGKLDEATQEMKDAIELYNQDDCISTHRLHVWLEGLREELIRNGVVLKRPLVADGATPEELNLHLQRIQPIYDALMEGVSQNSDERVTPVDRAKYILAHMLNWYRREKKSFWWEYFRLLEMPAYELIEEKGALSYLQFTGEVETIKRSVIETYTFPYQDTDIKKKDKVKNQDGNSAGTIESIDLIKQEVRIKKGAANAGNHPISIFPFEDFPTTDKENAIIQMAEWIVENGFDSPLPAYRAGRDLLLRNEPRTIADVIQTDDTVDMSLDWALKLDNSILSIQGPPGTGKSYTASKMIIGLVRANKKVGITALSHKVITGLLEKVQKEANELGMQINMVQKVSSDNNEQYQWTTTSDNAAMIANMPDANVIAGTSFMWSTPNYTNTVDYLFVDEAGQLALIDTLAISQSTKNIILLGDPQQLQQPQQGVHPEGSEVSALEHIINGNQTISNSQGVFLKMTYRMHPSICAFDSELFYESKLNAVPELENQSILGNSKFAGTGLYYLNVSHNGNTNSSDEEVEVISKIVADLTKGDVIWNNAKNKQSIITKDDIKIITPYNAQVQKLMEKVNGVSIGTVDKFQGQEAPVIIYSVATSSPEDAPKGMDFLYSPNRFNVAVSRARGIFIMVANPAIFEPECKSPTQIKLANPFCRFVELAQQVSI